MRAWWLAALLAVPALSGCLSFLEDETDDEGVQPADVGYDPADIRVTGFTKHERTILGFDNVSLSAVIFEPQTSDALPDGGAPAWPVVVFLHGWGNTKEYWNDLPATSHNGAPRLLLEQFAMEGFLVAAYDARGFGRSGGEVSFAGPAEMADLSAVIDHLATNFTTNGFVGVTGMSYGAGQAAQAWAKDPRVTTAALHQGWTNLFDALAAGNVPKVGWISAIAAEGGPTSRARFSPMMSEWVQALYTRQGMDSVQEQMSLRDVDPEFMHTDKPLYVCDALQDSLMTEGDRIREAPGFVRGRIFTGGHGDYDAACWQETLDWFKFFLAGHANGVASWPEISTVDAANERQVTYATYPEVTPMTWSLLNGRLSEGRGGEGTFTVQQRIISNPFDFPDAVADETGGPSAGVPGQLRQDPTAVSFSTDPFTGPQVLMGTPVLTLVGADNATTGFQVVATLYHETSADGRSRQIGRTAYAVLDENDHDNGTIVLPLQWTRVHVRGDDRLILDIAANDTGNYLPLMANYAVEFTADSRLDLSFVD